MANSTFFRAIGETLWHGRPDCQMGKSYCGEATEKVIDPTRSFADVKSSQYCVCPKCLTIALAEEGRTHG